MAITVEQRTAIIELVVGMFGAAPGANVLSDLVAAYEAGSSIKQIAANLAKSDQFKSIFPTFMTNGEFATKVVDQLVGSEVVAAEKAAAVTLLTGQLNSGKSRSDVFADAISALNAVTSTNAAWGNAAVAFDNKVAAAVYYSVDKQLSGSSLAGLQAVVSSVTSSAASLNAAKAAADAAAAPAPAPVQTFTLTASAGSVEEGGNATFALTLDTAPSSAVTVNYVTATGTAGSSDYTSTAGSVTFAAGQTSQFVAIATTEDSAFEADETFTVTFSGSSLAESVTATGTITNDDVDTSAQALTIELTTGTDNRSGGGGNDIFNAPNAPATAAAATMNTVDTLVGGGGTDTLNITGQQAGATVALSNISGIEVVNVYDTTGVTTSLLGSSGVTTINSKNSTVATTFSNIGSTSVELGVISSAVGATFGFAAAAVAGTADTATLRLSAQTAGTNVVAGVETLNIISEGSANALTALTAAAATTLNISGNTTFDLGAANTVATTITSTNTAGVTLISDNAAAVAITGGSANDTITLAETAAVSNNVNGGAGDDTITFTQNLDTGDTVAGGDGTDILVALSADLAAATYTRISGIETITVSDGLAGALNTENIQAGIATVNLQALVTQTVTMGAGSKTINLIGASAAGAQTLTVVDTGTGITDSLTITNGSAAANAFNGSDILDITGYETVTVNTSTSTTRVTQALGAIGITPDTGGSVTLNFSGNNSVTTGVITATSATGTVHVDASGLTGTRTFTNVGATVGVTRITGTANGDTIVGSATATTLIGGGGSDNITGGAAADSIDGGAGNDVIVGGGGNDVITAGDGNDSISVITAAGAVNIDAGAGNDTILSGGFITVTDLINGGDGTDTLTLLNADLTALNAMTISQAITMNDRISNIESITLGDDAAQSIDVGRLDSLSTINVGDIDNALTISGLGATNLVTSTALLDNALTLSLADATGSADRVNYATSSAAGIDNTAALIVASVETIGITSNDSDATTSDATDEVTLTAANATSVIVDGDSLSLALTLTGSVAMTNLNASAYLGALTAISVSTAANVTMTGGVGDDQLTGSSSVDLINGGAGGDTLTGGAGADTINGEAGADSLVGGTGADSLTGGEGADSIAGGVGNDTIVLTETTATADDVQLATAATNGVDTVTGFSAGTTGLDKVVFIDADTTKDDAAGAGAFEEITVTLVTGAAYDATAALTATTTTLSVVELKGTNTNNGDLSLSTNGTELLKLLGTTDSAATAITVDANSDKLFFIAYDNGNAYVYHADSGADSSVTAAEITLVGVFNGVAANGFASGDIVSDA